MNHYFIPFLAILSVSLTVAQTNHRDPSLYPSKGDAAWCDTSGGTVVKQYEDIYRGETPYSIGPTPKNPNTPAGQPEVYYSPAIDGFLEDSLWKFAETLLINTWTDGGMTDACSDAPNHSGPRDLHAIWRFMYNREGLFIGVETYDNIHDVDSLSGWYLQDGIEIGIDPYDWGYYAANNWKNSSAPVGGLFKRYMSNNQQVIPCGGAPTCTDNSHLSYFHILKRMNEEPYLTGLIHGVHLYNYGRGDEATNFRQGDNNLYGTQFAVRAQGVDEWFREVHHVEFKFPFHTELWNSLDATGAYFDATGLPKSGTLLKMDFFSNDDDVLGPNGSNPNYTQVGRRREQPFAQEASGHDHWSDTKYYQTFKYAASNRALASPFVGSKSHGDLRVADVWVDAATETQRYNFTVGGAVELWGTFYFYDSTGVAGGEIKGAAKAADYVLKTSSTSKYQDTLIITPVISQPPLKLLRFLALGYNQLEGRWVESKSNQAFYHCNIDSTVYFWEPTSDTALEFRFVPLTKMDTNGVKANPKYNGVKPAADSVRIYRFKTQQLLQSYAYTVRAAVTGRSIVHFTYDFDKLAVYENDPKFPKHLVVNWGGQQKNFVGYGRINTAAFGETGLNKNSRFFFFRLTPKNPFQFNNFIMWDKYKHQIYHIPDTTNLGVKGWVAFYPDMIMSTDSSKANYWEKAMSIQFSLDTTQLVGYTDSTDATSLYKKPKGQVWGDSVYLRQEVTFVVDTTDTFRFWDTTMTQMADEFAPNYIAPCDSFIGVENALAPAENLEIGAFPNPFNPAATVLFSIPPRMAGEHYSVKVFNIRGQLVRTLVKGKVGLRGITRRRVVWPGINNLGQPMGSGMYYYKLIVGNQVKRGTLVMVK